MIQHIDTRALSSYRPLVVQDVETKTSTKGPVSSLRDEAQGRGKVAKLIALRAIHENMNITHMWTERLNSKKTSRPPHGSPAEMTPLKRT